MIKKMYRSAPLAALLLAVMLGSTEAQQSPSANQIDTDYQPSKDLPAVQNRKGADFAVDGQCQGIDEMAMAYYRWRKQNPNSPDLATVSKEWMAKQGFAYIENTLDLATAKSYARGMRRSEPSFALRNPDGFEHKLVQQLQATHEPQSIRLTPPSELDPIGHQVTIYGAQKIVTPQGERWEFKVADSSQFGVGDPDKVRLVYVPGPHNAPGHWSETIDGKEVSAWRGGDVIHGPIDKPSDYVEIIQRREKGDKIGDIRKDLDLPQHPLDKITPVTMVKDPKAGGVMLRFDPSLFSDAVPEAEMNRLQERFHAFLAQEGTGAAVFRLRSERLDLHLVSLKSLLAADTRTLGDLTRVRGYVRSANGEIYLVGLSEPGKPPIPVDELVVALRTVYKNAATPYISLDPDPRNFSGPQKVRIGEIPAELHDTAYVRALVDADYLMKRISLGKVPPKTEGFQRWIDILAAGNYGENYRNRMWLSPLAAPSADVLVTRRPDSEAVLFESHVQAQAEEMLVSGDLLTGAGGATPDAERAADQLTQHFEELAEEFPEFAGLQQVFDVSKLAVAWRAFDVRSADIDALLARKPAVVTIAVTYPGIGPEPVAGKTVHVSGGATTECRIYRKAAVETDCLTPLLDAAGHADAVPVTLPEEMDLGAAAAVACQIDAYVDTARIALMEGDCDQVVARTSAVLEIAADHREARILRADAYTLLGRLPEARADFDVLAAHDPEAYAHRAIIEARMDDLPSARKDIAEALRLAPDSDRVKYLVVLAYMEAVDLPNAALALDAFQIQSPTDPLVPHLKDRLVDLQQRSPAEARRYLRLESQIPPRIAMVFQQAQPDNDFADVDIPRMQDVLTQVESGAVTVPAEMEIPYRARLSLLYGYGALGKISPEQRGIALANGDSIYRRLIQLYPQRAIPHIVRAQMAVKFGEPAQTAAGYLRKAAALSLKDDPIYSHIRSVVGTDRILDSLAVELWGLSSRPEARANELLDLVREHSSAPEAALIRALENETEIDLPAFLRGGASNLDELDQSAKRKYLTALVQLTRAIPDNLPADSPLTPVVSRLFLNVSLIKFQLSEWEGFEQNTLRGVAVLTRAHPAVHRDDSPGKSLGIVLSIYSLFAFKESGTSQKAQLKKLDESEARMQRLEGPPAAPLAQVQAEIAHQADLGITMWHLVAERYRHSLAQLETHGCPLGATLGELMVAIFQEAGTADFSPPAGVVAAYPNIAHTKEFQTSLQRMKSAALHAFTPRNADTLFTQSLSLCKTPSDYEAVASFLELLRELNASIQLFKPSPAYSEKLIHWEEEARYRSEQSSGR